ncbi:unnamed protein product [Prorocentrum cordatum]|uniref:Uncharacterized protein n=1 Tax=Prorocentrum cordatum TaxID=2364126 RepID=A0ABN9UWN3_9DINO|nr:unnamed protein product [Polarella glacialis]
MRAKRREEQEVPPCWCGPGPRARDIPGLQLGEAPWTSSLEVAPRVVLVSLRLPPIRVCPAGPSDQSSCTAKSAFDKEAARSASCAAALGDEPLPSRPEPSRVQAAHHSDLPGYSMPQSGPVVLPQSGPVRFPEWGNFDPLAAGVLVNRTASARTSTLHEIFSGAVRAPAESRQGMEKVEEEEEHERAEAQATLAR